MMDIASLGRQIAHRRKDRRLRQGDLAQGAGVSRATLNALENGRSGELGFNKILKILSVLDLDLRLTEASAKRPTLDDLLKEDADDQGMDRRP